MNKEMNKELVEMFKALLIHKAEQKLVERLSKHYGGLVDMSEAVRSAVMIEEEQLSELGSGVLARYISKSQHQLRQGTYASKHDPIKVAARKRINRRLGVARAQKGLDREEDKELKPRVDEGIFSALGHLTAHLATQTIAGGLGVHHSTVHNFISNLKHKTLRFKVQKRNKIKAGKPQHFKHDTKPSWSPVEMHHVFHGTPGEHEHHLQQAVNHHNIASWAKHNNDHSKAEVHFRARDKHLKTYISSAPQHRLKMLNPDKVKGL